MLGRVAPWLIPLLGTIQPDVGTDPKFTEYLRKKYEKPGAQPSAVPLWKRLLIGEAADPDFDAKKHFGFKLGDSPAITKSGDSPWTDGTSAIQHLDMSSQAASAGTKTGEAFKENFGAELRAVDQLIQQAMQRWGAMLGSFSASPSITPKVSDPTGGQKRSDATSLTHSRHAAFSDATNFGYV